MLEAVSICVIPHTIGDGAYDDACLQRCLAALASGEVETAAEIVVVTNPGVATLDELISSRADEAVLLLASDTEPEPGFLSLLLAAKIPRDGITRVYSPKARGVLSWRPLPDDWGPTTASRFPRQAVLFESADWPQLRRAAERDPASIIEAIIDAAEEHVVVDDATVLSHRPETLAQELSRKLPRLDITRCAGAVISASAADFGSARSALRTWLELSMCGIHQAREPLSQWRSGQSRSSAEARSWSPRWMTHCDQHAEAIIHESLLCPSAVEMSRDAVERRDAEAARSALMRYPDSYCAAVAVMSLMPETQQHEPGRQIPRVVVQGWFDSDLPADALPKIDTWVRLHPGWRHLLFDTPTAESWISEHLGSELASIFRSAKPVAKSNLLRYAYLAQEGGVWSDIDDRAVSSIDALIGDRGFVVLRESLGAIGDNFIAVTPGHPVLIAARDEAFRNEGDGYEELQWLANGPAMFTRKVANWVAGITPDGACTADELDYLVVPGTRMCDFVAVHEHLEYKATPLAWDANEHRTPSGSLYRGDVPIPQSVRQRALAERSGRR